jgi:hypothetical protein
MWVGVVRTGHRYGIVASMTKCEEGERERERRALDSFL